MCLGGSSLSKNIICCAAALLLLRQVPAFADAYTFSLLPSNGNVSGVAGSVVGWGYKITNDSSTDWLKTAAVNAGLFQHATLDSGDYFNFPLVAPDSTVTVAFVPAVGAGFGNGLAALTLAINAPLGFTNSGDFDLSACFANAQGSCLAAAPDAFAPYSATVISTVPEPSGSAPLAFAAILFASLRNRRRKRKRPS